MAKGNKKGNKDENLKAEAEKGTGSNKKLIFLAIGGAFLLLATGMGISWFLFAGVGRDDAAGDDQQKRAEEVKPPAIYHPLDPAFVVNLLPGGKAKMLQVSLQVLLREPDMIEFLEHNDPMLRHNLLNLFESQDESKLRDRKGKEKLQKEIAKTLNGIVKKLDGPGEIEAVFFTAFVMQ